MMLGADEGLIYEHIGHIMVKSVRFNPIEAFLYARAGDQWVSAALYEGAEDRTLYRTPNMELTDAILEAWEFEEEAGRWSEIHYTLSGSRFSVKKVFSDEIDPKEDELDRRDRIVREKFGDKPIDYSDP